ncbi:MAG: hypothetical protein ACK5JT_22655, partial [Hyphomicrobiaceae bacterium]
LLPGEITRIEHGAFSLALAGDDASDADLIRALYATRFGETFDRVHSAQVFGALLHRLFQ